VLLHGAVCDSRVWRHILDGLSDGLTVVAWDAPGCGRSEDPPESFRLPDFADVLAGFLDTLALERPHVLGHSFGGALAIELHRRHPTVPRSLILVGAYAGWAGSLEADEVERRLRSAHSVADRLRGRFDPFSMPGFFSDAMPPTTVSELAAIMSEIRPAATRTMAHALAEADLRDALSSIDVPTLLLYGDADERSPVRVAEDLQHGIPGSKLVLMAGLGHELYLEAPEQFEAEIRRFLKL
jgi:pimeloyl-ACP methyl ester carboxylesterase